MFETFKVLLLISPDGNLAVVVGKGKALARESFLIKTQQRELSSKCAPNPEQSLCRHRCALNVLIYFFPLLSGK